MNVLQYRLGEGKGPFLNEETVRSFQKIIYTYYGQNGRRFPWRETSNPYHILVSEIMLQQTQVERVASKYIDFIGRFPDPASLSNASLREILHVWQGLGYNRRAIALQKISRRVIDDFRGRIPDSQATLRTFPGIGDATAGAIVTFAFNMPAVFIETNIRRVFLHFFFPGMFGVPDRAIRPLVDETLDRTRARHWYYALMDYGTWLKARESNPNRRSAHYGRQAPFQGSDREIRGLILRSLLTNSVLNLQELSKATGQTEERVKRITNRLVEEGFLQQKGEFLGISN